MHICDGLKGKFIYSNVIFYCPDLVVSQELKTARKTILT